MGKILLTGLGLIALLYLAAALALFAFQRRLIYRPDPAHVTPAQAGLTGVAEVRLAAPGGVEIVAWEAKAREGKPTFLYFHGNGGGLVDRSERIRRFALDGYGVFMPAYRGYSGSTGSPSEAAIIADAQRAYDHLIAQGLKPQDIVLYGESLGTGVAVQLAAAREVSAVVLDSPYTSLVEIGQRQYGFMPVKTFMVDTFSSIDHIGHIKAPLLVLHGNLDSVIPVELGQKLFDAAPEPKQIVIVQGAGHSDIYAFGALQNLQTFLRALKAGGPPRP